jgi:hypothetical protein
MIRYPIALIAAVLAGCSVQPAPLLTIPQGHPANAGSGDAPYEPPPNPFKQEVPPPSGQKEEKHDPSPHEHGPAAKKYPLDTCPVSGEKLGSMGDPVILKHEGREVRLCCPGCIDKFKQDPPKYLKKLDEREKKKSHEGHK